MSILDGALASELTDALTAFDIPQGAVVTRNETSGPPSQRGGRTCAGERLETCRRHARLGKVHGQGNVGREPRRYPGGVRRAGLFSSATTGPRVREAQRHLARWTLQPIAALLAEEASEKLGGTVTVDVLRPLQAYDSGGRARALLSVVQALAAAREGNISPADLKVALDLVDW